MGHDLGYVTAWTACIAVYVVCVLDVRKCMNNTKRRYCSQILYMFKTCGIERYLVNNYNVAVAFS